MRLPFLGKPQKQSTVWIMAIAALGVLGTAIAVPLALQNSRPKQNLAELTVLAAAKNVTVQIAASGEVVPVKTVNLNPKVSGILQERLVKQGDRVRPGQLIARMENRNLQAQLAQAQASLDQARASLSLLQAGTRPEVLSQTAATVNQSAAKITEAQAGITKSKAQLAQSQARLQRTKIDFDRKNQLYGQGAITRSDLDLARQDYEVAVAQATADEMGIAQSEATLGSAQAGLGSSQDKLSEQQNGPRVQEIDQAAAQVAAAAAQVAAVNTQLEDTQIRAPFGGIITQTGADDGAFVTPTSFSSNTGSATLIATLASDLEIVAKVPEVDIGQIKSGQWVEIRTDAYPKAVFKGTVRLIAPEAIEDATQRGVRTFEVRIRIQEGKEKMRSKMSTDLLFLGEKLADALIVPTVAIVTNKGQTGVLVVGRDNKPLFKPVTIGPNIGNETQIIDGIQAGDGVFVALPEGQKLETIIKGLNEQK
jgi:HlyD family secretion protein